MEPYNQNKPFISMKLDGSLLDRLVEAGIPLTRALKYFRDNPEGSAMETARLVTEDRVPFYGSYRNGGGPIDYLTEAALMFSPAKGHRVKVRTMPDGTPNLKDLGIWYNNKLSQLERVEREIINRDPSTAVEDLNQEILRKELDYKFTEELVNSPDKRKYYGYPDSPLYIKSLEGDLSDIGKELMDLRAKRDQKALDILDYNGMTHKDYIDKFGGMIEESDNMPFLDRQIRNEYGKGMSRDEIDKLYSDAWSEYSGMSYKDLQDYINNYH